MIKINQIKMNKMEKRYSFSPIGNEEYRAQISGDISSRHIKGYGVVFNQKSKIITEYISDIKEWRSFTEIIDSSAFDEILNNGFDVVMDVNHDFNEILGRTSSETLKLNKDDNGISYEFDAPNTTRGEDVLQMVKRGDYYESSFAFTVAEEGDNWELDKDSGLYIRTITKAGALYDMAICTYRGAYDNTDITINEDERVFDYKKEDVEVASRKLNELIEKEVELIVPVNKKQNEDFITRIYLKRNWDRKKVISRNA
jgi:Escherichia/Staphylococcus phage prohead protease